MPVHVRCPHCQTLCVVAEQHRGVPVKCGRCGGSFITRAEITAPIRLDVGAAGESGRFLAQHLVYWNLDERHELAVLVLAGPHELSTTAATLTSLLSLFLSGAKLDAGGNAEKIDAAVTAIICDGRLSLCGSGECAIYHRSGDRVTRLRRDPVCEPAASAAGWKLTAGDWLVFADPGSPSPLDESVLPRAIGAAAASAAALAEHLAQSGGTILTVRCY